MLTHGFALSNLPLFVAKEFGCFREEGIESIVPELGQFSDTVDLLRSGGADAGTCAFTSALTLCESENPVYVVAGSGVMGIAQVAAPEIRDWQDLTGRRVGTFRNDPLEVMLHDYLKAKRVDGVEIIYFENMPLLLDAFHNGEVDACSSVEPYASQLVGGGATLLGDGKEIWGPVYPDTVLVASASILKKDPDIVVAIIRAMLRAEQMIALDPEATTAAVAGRYYSCSPEELLNCMGLQPPRVDIRDLTGVVMERVDSMIELGHLSAAPSVEDVFDFSFLETALKEMDA